MNALLAFTVEIPDLLFDGRFWGGFFTAFFIMLVYSLLNFNPFGR